MAKNEINLNLNRDVLPATVLTIGLSGLGEFRVRLWIAKWFFRVGARIIGTGIEFVETK